jgi:hypothetical protein
MSIRIEYKCSKCGNVFSPLSKKGLTSLHTDVGIPLLKCTKCNSIIKTGHKAFSDLNKIEKFIEWTKATTNALILGLLFGGIIGFVIGVGLDEFFPLERLSYNLFTVTIIASILIYKMIKTKRDWFKFSDQYKIEKGEVINSNEYDHPDW